VTTQQEATRLESAFGVAVHADQIEAEREILARLRDAGNSGILVQSLSAREVEACRHLWRKNLAFRGARRLGNGAFIAAWKAEKE